MKRVKLSTAVMLLGAVIVAGCETRPPCEVNPTSTNDKGQCVEADGEFCDDDPCDAESDSDYKPKKKPSRRH